LLVHHRPSADPLEWFGASELAQIDTIAKGIDFTA